jgi:transcriptional regulator with XRE-family HTH domain
MSMTDPLVNEVAEKLRARRIKLNMSQKEVAVKTGVSQAAISDLERGRIERPRLTTVVSWARALGLEMIVDFHAL